MYLVANHNDERGVVVKEVVLELSAVLHNYEGSYILAHGWVGLRVSDWAAGEYPH